MFSPVTHKNVVGAPRHLGESSHRIKRNEESKDDEPWVAMIKAMRDTGRSPRAALPRSANLSAKIPVTSARRFVRMASEMVQLEGDDMINGIPSPGPSSLILTRCCGPEPLLHSILAGVG